MDPLYLVTALVALGLILMLDPVWETLYKAWDGLIDRVWRS